MVTAEKGELTVALHAVRGVDEALREVDADDALVLLGQLKRRAADRAADVEHAGRGCTSLGRPGLHELRTALRKAESLRRPNVRKGHRVRILRKVQQDVLVEELLTLVQGGAGAGGR